MRGDDGCFRPAPTTPPSTPPSISRQSINSLRSRYLQGLGYHNVKGAVRVGVEVFQLGRWRAWLLASSVPSARTSSRRGLAVAFASSFQIAHHDGQMDGTREAFRCFRVAHRPSSVPCTFSLPLLLRRNRRAHASRSAPSHRLCAVTQPFALSRHGCGTTILARAPPLRPALLP